MKINIKHIIAALIVATFLTVGCTPTHRVSQSQQSWNEYKGKDMKKVVRKDKYKKK